LPDPALVMKKLRLVSCAWLRVADSASSNVAADSNIFLILGLLA
jgi:hypothetical protein